VCFFFASHVVESVLGEAEGELMLADQGEPDAVLFEPRPLVFAVRADDRLDLGVSGVSYLDHGARLGWIGGGDHEETRAIHVRAARTSGRVASPWRSGRSFARRGSAISRRCSMPTYGIPLSSKVDAIALPTRPKPTMMAWLVGASSPPPPTRSAVPSSLKSWIG